MWKTVVLLLITLIGVPVLTFLYDTAPGPEQWAMIQSTYLVCILFAALCFVVSSLTGNYSQVDKLWSLLPLVYAWMVWRAAPEPRVLLMAILITLWGLRLTYNFSRRGGYSWKFWTGEEDYRWSVLRARPEFQSPWKWFLFNLFFISFYQMSLIWMMTTPIIKAAGGSQLGLADYILAAVAVGWIIMETVADQQQWNFQNEKHRLAQHGHLSGTKYEHGFVHDGLWGVVRHPNYLSEQAFWVTMYAFSVAATGSWVNWSIAGCLLLVLLFKGSSDFSEEISARKYPGYKDYQKKVPRFLPFLK